MWQNGRFGANGIPQNNFNGENLPSSPFGSGSTGTLTSQQPNMTQCDDNIGKGFMNNNFTPEAGPVNENSFMQTQLTPQNQFSPPIFSLPPTISSNTPRPTTQINARAAELKALLLKGRGARVGSSTPPVPKPILPTKHTTPVAVSSAPQGSPKIPKPANEHREQEININELISQYSDTKSVVDAGIQKGASSNLDNAITSLQRNSSHHTPKAKSQVPSLGSPTKVTKPAINDKKNTSGDTTKQSNSGHISSGSISEGEILEESLAESPQPTKPKSTNVSTTIEDVNQDKRLPWSLRDQISRSSYNQTPRDASPHHGASKSHLHQPEIDRHEPARVDPRSNEEDSRRERKSYFEPERDSYLRRGLRDEYRNHEPRPTPKDDEPRCPSRKELVPTLADVLPHDNNLREWLDITGFHNASYRDNVLSKHRQLAQLDAQRLKLIADLEAERRQGVLVGTQPPSTMLPPPFPNSTPLETPLAIIQNMPGICSNRTITNKRPYSEVEDDGPSVRLARADSRSQEMRMRDEDEYDRSYSQSNWHMGPRRTSSNYREDRPPSHARYEDDRMVRGRENSLERELSPDNREYENRLPARFRPYDLDESRDRDDFEERPKRLYEVRGSYRGRAFDPSYRGRGRGRGRGDFQTQAEVKNEPNFGSKMATSKPFKDFRGHDRGGKGDTRYFIVKSFNEDDVLKSIEDSIWTAQVQNGSIFKGAFETCKNVILVFSINKSHAFQGYARMESLPGSVEVPTWKKSINWESTGAFKVKWLVICVTKFGHIGHLKNSLNDNQAVFIGKDGQEIEENCGAKLIELIDEEVTEALATWKDPEEIPYWDD
ncbi:YT521-B-like domain-containing protein [Tricladium varicosporioides]|nr:YT521-B-like domain-containing protein [Hymenoscyphus varicosporioides]